MFVLSSNSSSGQPWCPRLRNIGHRVSVAVALSTLLAAWPAAAQSTTPAITAAAAAGNTVVVVGRNLHGVNSLVIGDVTAASVGVNGEGTVVTATVAGELLPGTYALSLTSTTAPASATCDSAKPASDWVCVAGGGWVPADHPAAVGQVGSSATVTFVVAVGGAGPEGPAGPMGPQGPAGAGLLGPVGPIGPIGPAGEVGVTGVAGPIGPIGVTGLQGLIGLTGPQGPQGTIGGTGPAGIQGPIGQTGPEGPAMATMFASASLVSDPSSLVAGDYVPLPTYGASSNAYIDTVMGTIYLGYLGDSNTTSTFRIALSAAAVSPCQVEVVVNGIAEPSLTFGTTATGGGPISGEALINIYGSSTIRLRVASTECQLGLPSTGTRASLTAIKIG